MAFQPNDPNAARDRANMMMAVVISLFILLGFHFFVEMPRQEKAAAAARDKAQQEKNVDTMTTGAKPATATPAAAGDTPDGTITAAANAIRIPIRGARVSGSFPTTGGRIDDLTLNEHCVHVDETCKTNPKADHVALLTKDDAPQPAYIDSGWLAEGNAKVPNEQTVWSIAPGSAGELGTGKEPVKLFWDNGEGLRFEREISIDENFLFTLKQSVRNTGTAEAKLRAYHAVARRGVPPDFTGFYTLHEGPIAYLNNKEHAPGYKDIAEGRADWLQVDKAKGWIGITEKYWMVALLPDPAMEFKARAVCKLGKDDCVGGLDKKLPQHFQTDIRTDEFTVAPGGTASETTYVYAGVKNLDVMRAYQDKYKFDKLELGIDFGIYYIITKPFYYILHYLFKVTGSVGLGILLMTVIVRLFVFPLASKSFRSMAKMKVIAPRLKELQEKYKDDKTKLQTEIYELYRTENANPFSGCWPIIVQIPIIFALYKVILISVDLRHAPFWGWIHDLSAPDPTSIFNLFGLIPWTPPHALMIGAWPVLFCLTMVLQKRITPPMADATQERLQTWFPFIATVMMAQFAVGLIIYWTWSNVLSIFQQYYILKKVGGENTSLIRGHADRRKKKAKPE